MNEFRNQVIGFMLFACFMAAIVAIARSHHKGYMEGQKDAANGKWKYEFVTERVIKP